MDTTRLAAALSVVRDDFSSHRFVARVQKLAELANTASENPTDATHQDEFQKQFEQLVQSLSTSRADRVPLSIAKALQGLQVRDLTGTSLAASLNAIIDARPFLLGAAAKKLTSLASEVETSYNLIERTLGGLLKLGIEPAGLELNEYEVGVLMPTSFTNDDLRVLEAQSKVWIRALDALTEYSAGKRPDRIPVRSLSSSSFDLFLSLDPEGAIALLIVVGGVAGILTAAVSARKKRTDLEEDGYPRAVTDEMKRYEAELIEKGKAEILEKVYQRKAKELDEGRANELKTQIRISVDAVLEVMNEGVDVEVSPPPAPDEEEAQEIANVRAEIEEMRNRLERSLRRLPDRTKPLLELPKSDSDQTDAT